MIGNDSHTFSRNVQNSMVFGLGIHELLCLKFLFLTSSIVRLPFSCKALRSMIYELGVNEFSDPTQYIQTGTSMAAK